MPSVAVVALTLTSFRPVAVVLAAVVLVVVVALVVVVVGVVAVAFGVLFAVFEWEIPGGVAAYTLEVGNFVCPKGISLYRREYCINNKFSDMKCDYIYIKGDISG